MIYSLYKKLRKLNIELEIVEDQLKLSAPDDETLTPSLLAEIKSNKEELISFLRKYKNTSKRDHLIPVTSVREEGYPLSDAQRRLWILHKLDNGATVYNLTSQIRLHEAYDLEKFEKAVQAVISHHEILRTVFKEEESGEVRQWILDPAEVSFKIEYLDLSEKSDLDQENIISEYTKADALVPFNFETGPLLRTTMFQLSGEHSIFYFNMHHIISDGWSMNILVQNVMTAYEALISERKVELPELRIQYKDYAAWQLAQIDDVTFSEHKNYWLKQLSGSLPIVDFPSYKKRPAVKTSNGRRLVTHIDKKTTQKLKSFCQDGQGSLYMGLLAAFNVLFYRYTNQGDCIIGTSVAGRDHRDLEGQIGFYVNTLALRNKIEPGETFKEVFTSTRKNTLEAFNHQTYPFNQLISELDIKRDLSRHVVFDVMLTLHNQESSLGTFDLGTNDFETIIDSGHTRSKFDLELDFTEVDGYIGWEITYNEDVYDKVSIENLMRHYKQLLTAMLTSPEVELKQIDYLSKLEILQLEACNETNFDYDLEKTLLEHFKDQTVKNPLKAALKFENDSLSFQELDSMSSQLAVYIQSLGLQETLIPICFDRSFEMIIGLLGILKSGNAYVPIDPNYPEHRIQYILEDTQASYVLTQSSYTSFFKENKVIDLNLFEYELYDENEFSNDLENNQLAYCIYTSGTTGNPKGVLNSHKALLNRLFWMRDKLDINSSSVLLQKTPYVFDVSVWELTMSFVTGSTLVIARPDGHSDADYLKKLIEEEKVSIVHFVPSMLNVFLDAIESSNLKELKHVVCSGEALSPAVVSKFKKSLKEIAIYNLYGPTEAAIDVTFEDLTAKDTSQLVTIGKATANTQLYIVNDALLQEPIGVAGELLIGGVQVARGYLNKIDLTNEKFIENKFTGKGTLYKTGDVVRRLPDGSIEYLGRKDDQVKIRGYRIELGEVINHLETCQKVNKAVVTVKQVGDYKRLVGYLVGEQDLNIETLKLELKKKLPEYMIPSAYIILDEIPLTINGKVDRKQLPDIENTNFQSENYVAPKNEIETKIAKVWQELLGLDIVGTTDNFFSLGGDSIIAIQFVNRVKKQGIVLKTKDVFTYQTIGELAKNCNKDKINLAEQGVLEGSFRLGPIQQSFFESNYNQPNHYNQSLLLTLPKNISEVSLHSAISEVFKKHDILRTQYRNSETGYVANYLPEEPKMKSHDISDEELFQGTVTKICKQYQQGLNLEEGKIAEFVFIKTPASQIYNRFFMVIHHLAVDGVSWRILVNDLETCLGNIANENENSETMHKTTSFRQWQDKLFLHAQEDSILSEFPYWKSVMSRYKALPKDKFHESVSVQNAFKNHTVELSKKSTKQLLSESHHAFNTEINDLLIAALTTSVCQWANESDIVIGLEGHGREEIFDDIDLSETLGWFTTLYPVVLKNIKDNLEEVIIQSKETLRAVPNKGIGYGMLRYLNEDSSIRESLNGDIDQLVFNYLGQTDQKNAKSGIFGFASEDKGSDIGNENQNRSSIVINGIVSNGKLSLDWSYDSNQYEESTIKILAANYLKSLESIITYCKSVTIPIATPEDYGLNGLVSYEQLSLFKKEKHTYKIEDIYKLSPLQEGMLFHSLLDKDSNAYVNQLSFDLTGNIDEEMFKKVWTMIMKKHSILRSSFFSDYFSIPVQAVYENVNLPIDILNLVDLENDQQSLAKSTFLKKDMNEPFELDNAPLFRIALIKQSNEVNTLVFTYHHILIDGWSLPIIFSEYISGYEELIKGKNTPLLKGKDSYKDYIDYVSKKNHFESLKYWKNHLKDLSEASLLPFVKDKSKVNKSFGNNSTTLIKNGAFLEKLENYAKKNHLTINTIVQGVWSILLSKYTNQDTVAFGTVVSGRPIDLEKVENRVGLYINTILLCAKISPDSNVSDWLKMLQNNYTTSREEHGYSSLGDIQKQTDISEKLFDSIVVFENYPLESLNETDSEAKIANINAEEKTNYALSIVITHQTSKNLSIDFTINDELIDFSYVEMIKAHFDTLINDILTTEKISTLNYLTKKESIQLLDEFNSGSQSYPEGDTVLDLFNSRVVSQPSSLALVYGDDSLTYQELSDRSDEFCNYLLSAGLTPGSLVPICMDRSIDMMVGLLGILKSGCAYIPIDPLYPQDRIAYILSDTGGSIVVSTTNYAGLFEGESLDLGVVCMDDLIELPSFSGVDKALVSVPSDLAYVIYTSGTTGLPKGVMVSHSNLTSFLYGMDDVYPLDSEDRLCLKTNYTFDVSVHELFGWIKSGSSLVILKPGIERDMESFIEAICVNEITHLNLVPSLFKVFLESVTDSNRTSLLGLKFLYLAGEALPVSTVHRYKELNLPARLENIYGPTELTIYSTYYSTSLLDESSQSVSIGRPLGSTSAYVLGEDLELLPVGVSGELCLSGPQLTQGYLNRPDLTSEKFVSHPFKEGVQMYRTGDLVRWNLEGDIEYIGRKDSQVKIRGYRIELGEIESLLGQITGVIECVVIAFGEESSKRLIGYVQLDSGIEKDSIVSFLKDKLPEYMVPQHFIELDEFPLTNSGKIDRKRLPEPSEEHYNRETYIAAETEIEEQLVLIWQELLGIEKIGVEDNFFSLGGDSIKAIQLVSRSKAIGINYTVKTIFTHQTIRSILNNLENNKDYLKESGVLSDEVKLHPIQHEFFQSNQPVHNHYNQSVLLTISKTIDGGQLSQTVEKLLEHHDALRFIYSKNEKNELSKQRYGEHYSKLVEVDVADVGILSNLCDQYQSDLDIYKGDLVRFVLFKTSEEEKDNRLLIVVHHLAIDGVSWRILLEDLTNALINLTKDKPVVFPEKMSSFRQWTEALNDYSVSEELSAEFSYWKKILDKVELLPEDKIYDGYSSFKDFKNQQVLLDKELTNSLFRETHQAFGTQINDILLSALAISLSKWTEDSDVVIGLEGHGREELFDKIDITRTIGWFTTVYPVLLKINKDSFNLDEIIANTKDNLRSIPNKGIGFGVLKYLSPSSEIREALSDKKINILFNYLGSFDNSTSNDSNNKESIIGYAQESFGNEIDESNTRTQDIVINAMLVNNVLQFNWNYDSNRYHQETIEALTTTYIESLKNIIAHCKSKDDRILTPSDYKLPSSIDYNSLLEFKSLPVHQNIEIEDIVELSPLQEGLLYHSLYDQNQTAYVVQFSCEITGSFSYQYFKESWEVLMDRHTILRTIFAPTSMNIPVQCIYKSLKLPITIIDYSEKEKTIQKGGIKTFLQEDQLRGFDFEEEPLFRITLIKLGKDKLHMVFTNHHILWDGWSFSNMMSEFSAIYSNKVSGTSIPKVGIDNFGEHVRTLKGKNFSKGLSFWNDYLSNLKEPTYLPFIEDNTKRNKVFGNRDYRVSVDKSLRSKVKSYAEENRITINTIIQGAWLYLLAKYTGNETVCFGATVSGRDSKIDGIEQKIGLYINTIMVCHEIKENVLISEWLQEIQRNHMVAREEHCHIPLSKIESQSEIERSLFDSLYIFENYPVDESFSEVNEKGELFSVDKIETEEHTNYSLSLIVSDSEKELSVKFMYNEDLLSDNIIVKIGDHLKEVLTSLVNDSNHISDLNYLTTGESIQLLDEFNSGSQSYPEGDTVLDLFNSRVVSQPSSLALVYGDDSLTYQELSDRSDEFCNYLLSAGLTPGSLVPICMDRSIDMMVGLLGILKSGCAYIPIDPLYPQDRIAYILSDTGGSIVVSTTNYAGLFEGESLDLGVVCMDDLIELPSFSGVDKALVSVPSDLAYVIYTSGTTGLPKGVMVSHSNLTSFLYGMDDVYPLDSEDRLCLKTNYTFDVSVHELFGWIKSGSSLVILKPGIERDMESFIETIGVNEITHLNLVPSLFKVFLESVTDSNRTSLLGLKFLYLAGEALPVSTVHRYKELNLPARLENIYGPTELTIYSTYYSTSLLDESSQSVSIGRPLGSTSAYVLGEDLELLPVGVSGELCLSGPQLTQGYLNRPDLTSEKFVSHPFKEGVQMYRTGDLVRWNLEGDIEYIGRKDSQVKIRGYRIELGEIESLLGQITGVIECVVIAFGEESSKRLIGYVQLDSGIEKDSIVSFLKDKLPEYMVPQHFIELDEFPLTNSGKIDRKRLPEPSEEHYNRETYIAAETEIEEQLVLIWQELLGIEKIGVEDNFFSLGGDSIKAIQLVSRSNRAGIFYKVKDIFKYQHIRGISSHLEESVPVIEESGVLSGIVGLHPIQKQFFEKQYEASHHYNQSMLLKLSKTIDKKLLTEAVQELVSHHDVLRFSYEFEKGYKYPIQSYGLEDLLVVDHEVSDVSELEEVCSYYQSDLDPLQGEMFRFVLIRTPSSETANRLFITVHHLSIDGVSWRILLEDLSSLLSQIESGDDLILPAKQTSYRQWVSKLEFHSNSSIIESEYLYWKRVLSGYKPLEVDHDCADITTYAESSTHTVTLDKENTYQLLHDLHDAYGTEINDILLSALSMSFSKYTSADRLVIGLEGHGREELFDEVDITRTLGWFTSLFPVSLGLKNTEEIGLLISDTKDMLRAIPHKGLSYGMLRYQSEKEEIRSGLSTDYEDVVFNYLGNFGDSQEKENEESIIGFAGESKGQDIGGANKIPNKIGINIIEIGGMLHMYWTYDQKRYKASTIEQLAQDYINSLEAVIAHCINLLKEEMHEIGDDVILF